MSRLSILAIAFTVAAAQHQYLPWELQNVGSNPAWYAPKPAGYAGPAGSSFAGSSAPSSAYLAPTRTSYPPNFPGYPTFGTVQPVGGVAPKSGGVPYSYTTHKPKPSVKSTPGSRSKPINVDKGKSNLDKYLPLMKKKNRTTTTTTTTVIPTTTRRRRPASKVPARRSTVTTTTRRPTTTVAKTTTVPKTKTTTVEESGEWESVEIVETKSTVRASTTERPTTTTVAKKEEKKEEKLVKVPITTKSRPSIVSTTVSNKIDKSEEEVEEFDLLGFLWDKSELLASIKNVIKQLKTSIDEAGLEEDVKQVSDHFKNTIKTFASASPVNEQLGRLFERAQNADIKVDKN